MRSEFTILVVDVPENISAVVPILKEKYHTLAAKDAIHVLKIAQGGLKPDLILLDVAMDGYKVLDALKSDDRTADIPVIFLGDVDDIAHGFEAGVVDYIAKPVESSILLARVKTHIQLSEQSRKLKKYNEELLKEHKEYANAIFDTLNEILVINDGDEMLHTNKAFFDTFPRFKSYDDFKSKHKCICELFEEIEDDEYIYNGKGGKNWITILEKNPKKHYKVRMLVEGVSRHYSIGFNQTILLGQKRNIALLNDITEHEISKDLLKNRVREELEKQRKQEQVLIQQSKMASMGEMIGAIAHNWRQPLNTVSLIVEDLLMAYEENELDSKYLEESVEKTMKQIRFMSDTIDDFRNFFEPSNDEEEFDLKESINQTIMLITAQLKNNNISLELNYDESIKIKCNKNQFRQALINIFINSKDAILTSRENKIMPFDATGVIGIETFIQDNQSVIKIYDNGGGVDEKILANIFNAYFTTKDKDKGTGIGLYMTKTIIEHNMKGSVTAYNNNDGLSTEIRIPNV